MNTDSHTRSDETPREQRQADPGHHASSRAIPEAAPETLSQAIPQAATPFIAFTQDLRGRDFAVASEQTESFLAAVALLGPDTMQDIHRAAVATLAPPIERRPEFDALFRQRFLGQTLAAPARSDDESDDIEIADERAGDEDVLESERVDEVGSRASSAETLHQRRFDSLDDPAALAWLRRHGQSRLPRRVSRRFEPSPHGRQWDLRRNLKDAVRRDGEVFEIARRRRRRRQRRIVLLIDVSGSMKAHTDSYLRFAHALGRIAASLEVFTLGTRLTRVSRALRHRDIDQALASVAIRVADFDGGTRLGDALGAFLEVPRFAGFTRGSLVLVLSDGLERGDPSSLHVALSRLSGLAWHLAWLNPLVVDPAFEVRTEAMLGALPHVDALASAANAADLCRYVTSVSA